MAAALVAPVYLLLASGLALLSALGLTVWIFEGLPGGQGLVYYVPCCWYPSGRAAVPVIRPAPARSSGAAVRWRATRSSLILVS